MAFGRLPDKAEQAVSAYLRRRGRSEDSIKAQLQIGFEPFPDFPGTWRAPLLEPFGNVHGCLCPYCSFDGRVPCADGAWDALILTDPIPSRDVRDSDVWASHIPKLSYRPSMRSDAGR